MNNSKIIRKITLINSDGEYKEMESNKGAEAVMISSLKILRKFYPDAEYVTTIQSSERLQKEFDCRIIKNDKFSYRTYSLMTSLKSTMNLVRCLIWNIIYKCTKKDLKFIINTRKLKEYYSSDLIIHLGMDLYSDDFGYRTVAEHSKDILQAVFLGKKVRMWAESIGPFRNKLTRSIAKFTLNKVTLITLRENISKSYLENISINKPQIHITMDPAFILDPASEIEVKNVLNANKINNLSKPIIGMSLSLTYMAGGMKKSGKIAFINRTSKFLQYVLPEKIFTPLLNRGRKTTIYSSAKDQYTNLMAKVVDTIIEELDADIFLIPHLQHPLIGENNLHEMVLQKSNHKNKINFISNECTAREVKGIIGLCDMMISGRMHAAIAALSQNIPFVGLSYSYKFEGIAAMTRQEKYVCKEITYENIIRKVMEVWNMKEDIAHQLQENRQNVISMAYANGDIIKSIE
jgi:colanic acid/amylovoran biosynthesis protein